jgi:hypothetical protein
LVQQQQQQQRLNLAYKVELVQRKKSKGVDRHTLESENKYEILNFGVNTVEKQKRRREIVLSIAYWIVLVFNYELLVDTVRTY